MDETPRPAHNSGGLRGLLRALSHRNFRLFFFGQSVSLIGTWMQQVAMTWLVWRLTHSTALLGVTAFCQQIPVFVLGPLAGVLTDRINRLRLLLLTQTLAMLQAFLLAFLTLTHLIEVWHILALSIFIGIVNTFDITARQVFITEMLENREDLPNAIALNSSIVNGARLVGPAVAGVLIEMVGEGHCFLLNGLSYLAVLGALLAMRIPVRRITQVHSNLLGDLRSGMAYAFGFAPIRTILICLAFVSVLAAPFTLLMPAFATGFEDGSSKIYGFLMAASGLGALTGAVYLAARKTVLGLGTRLFLGATALGLTMIVFTFAQSLYMALLLSYAAGFSLMVLMIASNTLLQTIVDNEMRGRVMSLYMMAFMGMLPFGNLLGGFLARSLGSLETVRLGGVGCVIAALWFASRLEAVRSQVRPLYIQRGILPDPAALIPRP